MSDILHKRILVAIAGTGFSSKQSIEEVKVLEISPSGKWVKIQNAFGQKVWKMSADVQPVEILGSVDKL